MRKIIVTFSFIASLCVVGSAHADGVEAGLRVGTAGLGAELGTHLSEYFGLRVGYNGGSISHSGDAGDVRYDAKIKLSTAMALADWFPGGGGMRLSGGLYVNSNTADAHGIPKNGTYTFNGVTYVSSSVGSVDGHVSFDRASPYLGLGWSTPLSASNRFGLTADLGVMYQKARTSLTGTCGAGLSSVDCAALQANVAAEEVQFRDTVDNYRFYPILSVGMRYRF